MQQQLIVMSNDANATALATNKIIGELGQRIMKIEGDVQALFEFARDTSVPLMSRHLNKRFSDNIEHCKPSSYNQPTPMTVPAKWKPMFLARTPVTTLHPGNPPLQNPASNAVMQTAGVMPLSPGTMSLQPQMAAAMPAPTHPMIFTATHAPSPPARNLVPVASTESGKRARSDIPENHDKTK